MEEIFSLLGDYGVVALLFAWFIYQFFKDKTKADTLKSANKDRKIGTDEVARQLNNEQEVCIAKMEKDIEFIRLQVSNHLPTAMKEMNERLLKHDDDERRMWKLLIQLSAKQGIDISNF